MTRWSRRRPTRQPAHARTASAPTPAPVADVPGAESGASPGLQVTAGASAGPGHLQRAAVWMAAGTTISRLTGLLRVVVLAYVLGFSHIADAYNLANTTPNMIYDIVLGGVLAATFIPVFVDRIATRDEQEAWHAISAVTTIAVVVLVVMTIAFWVLAPEVINAYTAFNHSGGASAAHLAREKAVALTLLRWFVPQVALYGFISLMAALLNTRRRFAAPMWVPIVNNLVVIVVLLWFHALVGKLPALAAEPGHSGDLVLLGLGTTVGVLLQALALLPALRGAGLERLRWRWDPRHEAVRTVLRLGGWTFGFVVANQVALYVVLALAVRAGGTGPVSSYTYAYTFLQMPYAVVAVSIMSAVTPGLAERWSTGDQAGFKRRLTAGLRATLAVIFPAAMGMLILAHPVASLLLGHGSARAAGTNTTGAALAMFALGLPGFCAFLYVARVLQAMQRTKTAFYLYLVENGLNVALGVALVGPLGVRGLALSVSIAYTVAAACGVAVLRRWLGVIGGPRAWAPLRRAGGAALVMGAAVLAVSDASDAQHGVSLLLRVVAAAAAGIVVYGGVATLLGARRPLALLTGRTLVRGVRTAASFDRDEVGRGSGLGTAWGDPRTPVNTGPSVRIVPAPGSSTESPTGSSTETRGVHAPSAPDAEPDHNDDDPGERRWVGGTTTSLRRRLPR
ncbi:MAG: murein biosynthesis integral membrane protein MurJ [Acidimicrobiales bacterium]